MTPRRSALLAVVIAVVAVVSGLVAAKVGDRSAHAIQQKSRPGNVDASGLLPAAHSPRAPELTGISAFLNTPPVTMRQLRGRVVLVDFWTYTCINCRRTFPFLRAMQTTYAAHGLTILGVHSPEFGFEKDPKNVAAAVKQLRVTWPVAEDPDMATWSAYRNQYWPADYLVDRRGRIRFTSFGEGGDTAIETAVRALLAQGGDPGVATVGTVPTSELPPTAGESITPESYFGAERGADYLAGRRAVPPGQVVDRTDRGSTRDVLYLDGRFRGALQYVETARAGATVRLHFRARDLYVLLAPAGAARRVEVRLDGSPVPVAHRGSDIHSSGGRTYLEVRSDNLLHVLTGRGVTSGELTLIADPGVRFFTFTFGG